ncbi:MAG TPA: lipopolysaccharide biosynthesis protein [Gaiellaceae bacterium]|jgi:PST family polysaccharide transporter/lipopolysaccharide exporter
MTALVDEPDPIASTQGDGLGTRVVSSARWIMLLRLGSMASLWISAIALAHLLRPSQYGLAGMAMVLVSFLTVFQESGLHAALVQKQERVQQAVDAASVYAPLIGLALGIGCFAAAPLAGLFFGRHEVTSLVRGLSIVFVLRGISQVPIALVQKELRFRPFVIVSLIGYVLQTAVAITLATLGAGAWSAIGGLITLEASYAALMWVICPIRPHPRNAQRAALKELLSYGRNLVGVNISLLIVSYVDVATVGRFLGPAKLGAYTIGYQTGKQPVTLVTGISNQLVFPAYAKLQHDLVRFKRAYIRSLRFITIVSVPLGLGLASVGGIFVRLVYGEKWHAAAPVLSIMALMGLVLSITATMGEVLKATNRPGFFFRVSLLEAVLVVILVLSLYRFGIAYVAAGVAVSMTVVGLIVSRKIGQILDIRPREWAASLVPPFAAGAVMVGAMVATEVALDPHSQSGRAVALVVLAIEGTAVYAAGLWLIARTRLQEFFRELDSLAPVSRLHRRLVAGRV